MSNVYKPVPSRTIRTPAWQQPLYDLSTTASVLMDNTQDLDDDVCQDISEMYENILRLERILYEEKTHGF
tara:strand:+ start:476 stop:685 length:210 start_codon:yes stop_codon:yes gene_type:complete